MMTRKDYIKTAEILSTYSSNIHASVFSEMVDEFALMFEQDNERFDTDKFFDACGVNDLELELA